MKRNDGLLTLGSMQLIRSSAFRILATIVFCQQGLLGAPNKQVRAIRRQ